MKTIEEYACCCLVFLVLRPRFAAALPPLHSLASSASTFYTACADLAVLLQRKLKSAIPVPFGCAVRPFSLLGHNQGVHIHEIELRNTFVPAHVHQCSKTPSVVPANGKKEVRLDAYLVNYLLIMQAPSSHQ